MREDDEGFLYPQVNEEECVDCGLCEKVCPVLNPGEAAEPQKVVAAINEDEEVRRESSSGGVFTLLAEETVRRGGVVFGAVFTADWQVEIRAAETVEQLAPMRGSKYVQASTGTSYADCEKALKAGREVLYTGTGCQVAGLRRFLRRDYPNLTTADFICHGTPSPKVWRMYLRQVTEGARKAVNDIRFRNKPEGWKRFHFTMTSDCGGLSMTCFHGENHYMRAFLSDICLRPSCQACVAKEGRCGADLTLADFWGIANLAPDMDDDRGTSLVIAHTSKGLGIVNRLKARTREFKLEEAIRFNPSYRVSKLPHPHREEFFRGLDTATDLIDHIDHSLRPTARQRLRTLLAQPKRMAKRFLEMAFGGVKNTDMI